MKPKLTLIGSACGFVGTVGAVLWLLARRTASYAQAKMEDARFLRNEIEVLEGEGGIVLS
jgi:hypothetical protein